MANKHRIIIVATILTVSAAWILINANRSGAAGTPSGASYTNITNFGPAPADFRPFRNDSPWNVRLPENPQNIDTVNTPIIKTYATNTPYSLFMTEDDNAFTGCVSPCAGLNQSNPVYVATNSDPTVTINCNGVYYGCYNDTWGYTAVSSIPGTFHIPAYARGGVNGGFGDNSVSIIQPDGTELDLYGCVKNGDWKNGDVIGGVTNSGGCILNGVSVASLITGYGFTESTGSGDTLMALTALYNEVVPAGATINHALNMLLSCPTGAVYPGVDLGSWCNVQGVPTGSLIHLNLSHTQIDTMISQGTLSPAMKPFYYALHDHGAYFLDGGNCAPNIPCFVQDSWPKIEDATAWIKNGQHNPWIDWFNQQPGVRHWTQDTGTPVVSFQVNLFGAVANYLDIISPCYAQGTCSDSIPAGPPPPPPGPPPPPPPPSATASFLTTNTTTQGSWKNVFGTQGYVLAGDATSYPSYASVSFSGKQDYTWLSTTSDARALQKATGTDRIASAWYGTTYNASIDFTDTQTHKVSVYAIDWDSAGRTETISIVDTATGTVLDTKQVSNFSGGQYLTWSVKGDVIIRATLVGSTGFNAVLSGIFFDSTGPAPLSGDINLDHIVNSIDWSIMNSKWFTSDTNSDINHDGIVNAIDYSVLNSNWFKTW